MFILCDAIAYGITFKNNERDRAIQYIVYAVE